MIVGNLITSNMMNNLLNISWIVSTRAYPALFTITNRFQSRSLKLNKLLLLFDKRSITVIKQT